MTIELMQAGLIQGLILAMVTYAIMIPFRLLNFQDLSAEGSYPLGAAITSCALISGINPFISILIGSFISGFIGIIVALIHIRLKVNSLLAGIILSSMAYTINLRILGKPNISLFDVHVIFSKTNNIENCFILLFLILLLIASVNFFLKTEYGLKFRAVGLNNILAKRYSISSEKYTMLGLFFSALIAGLAGGCMVQIQNYYDIYMGTGIVIQGLAALMIGEVITSTKTLRHQLLAPLVGAIIYQQLQGISLSFGLAPSDIKFFTASLVLFFIALRNNSKHRASMANQN